MTRRVERMLPLYEAKMLDIYDHRNADVVKSATAGQRQNQPRYLSPQEHMDPRREAFPIAWVHEDEVPTYASDWLIGFSDITSSTNERTFKSAALPRAAVGNTYPLMQGVKRELVLAQSNSFVFDYVTRQKVAGLHLNFLYVKQLPYLPPEAFRGPCPWAGREETGSWVAWRVAYLSCTSVSMVPMALEVVGRPQVFTWDELGRMHVKAELDAGMFHLFGLTRDEVDYVMETFPIVKRKDVAASGSYRTKELILAAYDAMQVAIDTGTAYVSPLDDELARGAAVGETKTALRGGPSGQQREPLAGM